MAGGGRPPVPQRQQGPAQPPVVADPDLIREFLAQQSAQIAVRQQELRIQERELDNSHEYAKAALDAQLEDRERIRTERRKGRRDRLLFSAVVVVAVAVFVIYALSIGKDAFAQEALKAVVYISAGALGGFAAGKTRGQQSEPPQEEP